MKNIYIVTSQVFSGGTATVTSNYYKMFKNESYAVKVISLDNYAAVHPEIPSDDLHCFKLFTSKMSGGNKIKKTLTLLKYFFYICGYLRRRQGVFIYVHFDPAVFGVINSFVNRKSKHVFTIHTNVYEYLKSISALKKVITKFLLKIISTRGRVVFLTKDVADKYKNKYKKSVVTGIPNFVSFNDLDHSSRRQNYKSKYGILFCGRISYDKNIEYLIKIYEKYRELGGCSILTVIGTGPEVSLLKEQVSNSKCKLDIQYLGHQSNISQFYKNASTLLFTSKTEGFGLTIVEALGYGLPVVSTNCPSGPSSILSPNIEVPHGKEALTERGYLLPMINEDTYTLYSEAIINLEKNFILAEEEIENVKGSFSEAVIFEKWKKFING